jgi:hypothetical protein
MPLKLRPPPIRIPDLGGLKKIRTGRGGRCLGLPPAAGAVVLLACYLMTAAPAWALVVKPGENLTLDGILTSARGEDDRQREVVYPAIRLRKPLVVDDGSGHLLEVTLLKLRLNRQQEVVFRRLNGKRVKVFGKIHYYEFGPNMFPNPAHFEVFTLTPR